MPRFAANLTMLFREHPMLERFAAARQAGFKAVEILFPYDVPGRAIRNALEANDLELALINTPPPNWGAGDRGFGAIAGGEEQFQHDFRRAIRYSSVLKPRHIHIMAGVAKGPEAHDCFVRNLIWATAEAPDQSLTIEPINPIDLPGYFLNDFDQAAAILDEVGAANLNLQFDVYHAQRITGDAIHTWDQHGHRAVHIQVARAEGRHEPDASGAINYPTFFERLDRGGYDGWVSAEYIPEGQTKDGLDWAQLTPS